MQKCFSQRSDKSHLSGFTGSVLLQMRESEKRKGGKRKNMGDDTEGHAMPGGRKPAKQGRK